MIGIGAKVWNIELGIAGRVARVFPSHRGVVGNCPMGVEYLVRGTNRIGMTEKRYLVPDGCLGVKREQRI